MKQDLSPRFVVAPSLPGYAFSTPLGATGWSMGRTARAWVELMRRLGYQRYGVHVVTDPLTAANVATFLPGMADRLDESDPVDKLISDRMDAFKKEGSGYLAIQNSRPQTIGYGTTAVTEILSQRSLNRATLARQYLLDRVSARAIDTIEHLSGMQSQAPLAPYVGLWTSLRDFDAHELSALTEKRQVIRLHMMRNTVISSARTSAAVPKQWTGTRCSDRPSDCWMSWPTRTGHPGPTDWPGRRRPT